MVVCFKNKIELILIQYFKYLYIAQMITMINIQNKTTKNQHLGINNILSYKQHIFHFFLL
eukprot:UN01398